MFQAEALYNLQKIDLELLKNLRRIKVIDADLENDETVAAAKKQATMAEERVKPLRARMRELELDIQATTQKAKSAEERLYSGAVKNPKELQDLQQEINSLKRRSTQLEEMLLEVMVALEDAEKTLDAHNAALKAAKSNLESDQMDLLKEQETLEAEVQSLRARQKTALGNVNTESLNLYKTMRKQKANQPIAVLKGDSCGVCGMVQTTAHAQAVRRQDSFVECENCGRILVDVAE